MDDLTLRRTRSVQRLLALIFEIKSWLPAFDEERETITQDG